MQSHLFDRVLVLDSRGVIMGRSSVKAVLVELFLGTMRVVVAHPSLVIVSPHKTHPVPEVVMWNEPVRFIMYRSQGPTRYNIFLRDEHTCGYCGGYGDTRDHILPKSRGGLRSWENIITACRWCNQRKGDRTPKEAGMPLLFLPRKPNTLTLVLSRDREGSSYPKSWKRFLENAAIV